MEMGPSVRLESWFYKVQKLFALLQLEGFKLQKNIANAHLDLLL